MRAPLKIRPYIDSYNFNDCKTVGAVSVVFTVTMAAQKKSMVGEYTTHLNHSGPVGLLVQFHTQVLHSNAAVGILRGSY